MEWGEGRTIFRFCSGHTLCVAEWNSNLCFWRIAVQRVKSGRAEAMKGNDFSECGCIEYFEGNYQHSTKLRVIDRSKNSKQTHFVADYRALYTASGACGWCFAASDPSR